MARQKKQPRSDKPITRIAVDVFNATGDLYLRQEIASADLGDGREIEISQIIGGAGILVRTQGGGQLLIDLNRVLKSILANATTNAALFHP